MIQLSVNVIWTFIHNSLNSIMADIINVDDYDDNSSSGGGGVCLERNNRTA